jgi:DNA-binding LacI/PurR family transcriptional regulator
VIARYRCTDGGDTARYSTGDDMRITEVAELSGVSIATVSRVLNGKSVTEELRRKVAQIIDAHGYKPNRSAQSLGRRKGGVSGIRKQRKSYERVPAIYHIRAVS